MASKKYYSYPDGIDYNGKNTSCLPARYVDLKRSLAENGGSKFQEEIEKAWGEVLDALAKMTAESEKLGTAIIPIVDFNELKMLPQEKIDEIKRRGSVIVKNVVDDAEALQWKETLKEYVAKNEIDGFPDGNKQFFEAYWSKAQVKGRSHPNVIATSEWLNSLYHMDAAGAKQANSGYSPDALTYADRFRIRNPGHWDGHRPHIDGGAIERWEDPEFKKCFETILRGSWKTHDPFDLTSRLLASTSMYGRPNQATVFRTFQGWLALSSTGPGEGTLRVFPDVLLSNAYIILRPFFCLKEGIENTGPEALKRENWVYDISYPEFPGIWYKKDEDRLFGPRFTDETHPHLRLDKAMVSVPRVDPGDMAFWHCDVCHSVESLHSGQGDSSVLYIPAVPTTTMNLDYVNRQAERFRQGLPPPDFPQDCIHETGNIGRAGEGDLYDSGKRAMGLVH